MGIKIIVIFFAFSLLGVLIFHMNNLNNDIADCVNNESIFKNFVEEHYSTVSLESSMSSENPIYPYKITHVNNKSKLLFCQLPVVESWLFKKETLFAFYILVKTNNGMIDSISKKFGLYSVESNVWVGDSVKATSYIWQKGVKIQLRKFNNIWDDRRFENCTIVVVTNMDIHDLRHSIPD